MMAAYAPSEQPSGITGKPGAKATDTLEAHSPFSALRVPIEKNAYFEILRASKVAAADPELPSCLSLWHVIRHKRDLWVPAADTLIMRLLDHKLIENTRNLRQRDRPCDPPALYHYAHSVPQLINRLSEIDRRAGPLLIVAAYQCQQHRGDGREVYRVGREQR